MTLRCSTFKPLVVLIKPPGIDKLKQLKVYGGGRSTSKLTVSDFILLKCALTKKQNCHKIPVIRALSSKMKIKHHYSLIESI